MLLPPAVLLQAAPPRATASAPSYDPQLIGRLLQNMLIVVLALLVVLVVVVILLRSRQQELIRIRRARRPKHSELENIWFENPIERRGEKPKETPRKDDE